MVLPSWLCAHVHSMLTSSWACRTGEFWIACDFCDTWYDGKCVQVGCLRAFVFTFSQAALAVVTCCTSRKQCLPVIVRPAASFD